MSKVDQSNLRQVVNKRVSSVLIEGEKLNIENTANGIFAYLSESIYNESADNFLGVFLDPNGITPYTGSFTVHYTSALIEFNTMPTVNVYARYRGGGSIIWAEDITNLNDAVKIIDNNAFYNDGSVAMDGNLNLANHAITNVTTINNIDITTHRHTGLDGTLQLMSDGIATSAITEVKIADSSVTTNKIANLNVTNDKIADSTITYSKLDSTSLLTGILPSIFDILYPIGSIYITVSDTCPIANYVGTWILVSQGRVLQGVDTMQEAGTTISAGLPDIKGVINVPANNNTSWNNLSGAFYTNDNANPRNRSEAETGPRLKFSASKGEVHIENNTERYRNDVYGKSDTVQPPAYLVNIFQRMS